MNKKYYRLSLTRKVGSECSDGPYYHDTKDIEFPYGAGKEFKTGAAALEAAEAQAQLMINEAGNIAIWSVGGRGSGTGKYIKDDQGQRHPTPWGWDGSIRGLPHLSKCKA